MAFPTFVGHGGAVQETVTTLSVVNSASAATGDYEILVCETMDQEVTLTTALGFVLLTTVSVPSGTATIATRGTFYERIFTGQGDPVITNDPGNHIIANIFTFRRSTGTWTTLADARSDVQGTGWETSSEAVEDTSGTMTGITTDTADQLICGFICAAKPDVAGGTAEMSAITNANLATITEIHDDAAASGNGGWIGAWTGEEATSGQAIGDTTYTKATASFKAHLIVALRDSPPAAASQVPILGMAPHLPEDWNPADPQGWNPW